MTANKALELNRNKMLGLVEQFLALHIWGFRQSELSITSYVMAVYDSESCRLQLVWTTADQDSKDSLSIYYGRLHAPSDQAVMVWKSEECYCWHRVNEALLFLDNLSPQESVDQFRIHGKWPSVMEQFRQSEIGKSIEHNQPEWLIRMHSYIWEMYGMRLFELFDLRHPELWEEFRQFLKEFYEIKGIIPGMNPPQYQRC